jgi:arsenate reductase
MATVNKIYHLANCSTCQRILKEVKPKKNVVLQDIKTEPMMPKDLEAMHKLSGSYEALFSRAALKYRKLGLHEKELTEEDYRNYILEEYTFLRRPVMILGKEIFIGNAPKVVAAAKAAMAAL